ncbi:MAG: RDD family protein [Steroidobacteraceae bacterium]
MHGARNLVVDSVTGVDLALPVAGPGARCYAFLIDWLIRVILFTAWYGIAALIYNGRWSFIAPVSPDAKWFVLVVMPAAAVYFLYHIVLEIAMHGRTPGKRMVGVHVAARDGSSPSVGALLTRNVFRLVDSLPLLYGVGLVATFVTREHVRIGDMAAGTFLAYERIDVVLPEHPVSASRERGGLSAPDVEIVSDLLLRWPSLDSDARHRLAIAILSRYGLKAATEPQTDAVLRSQLERIARSRPT